MSEIENIDKVTEPLKFGRKDYPNIYMEEMESVNDRETLWVFPDLPIHHGTPARWTSVSA